MKTITYKELQDLLVGTARAITTPVNVNGDTVKEYLKRLGHFDRETISASLDYCLTISPFFPAISQIITAANFLICRVAGIPSSAEAWAMVLTARIHRTSEFCEVGATLRETSIQSPPEKYPVTARAYWDHLDSCTVCHFGKDEIRFDHPVVKNTVRILGGYAFLFTDNKAADRSRFIKAYEEILERELRVLTLPDSVKGYIDSRRQGSTPALESMQALTKKLTSPQKNSIVPEGVGRNLNGEVDGYGDQGDFLEITKTFEEDAWR